jgi:hypothetical protein
MSVTYLPPDDTGRDYTVEIEDVIRVTLTGDIVHPFANWHDAQRWDGTEPAILKDTLYAFDAVYPAEHGAKIADWIARWTKGRADGD